MIVARRKPIEEIMQMISPYKKILVAGCNGCVAICLTGGEKEVGILSSVIKLAGMKKNESYEIGEITIERQCENEFIDLMKPVVKEYDAVLSLGCGIGVQLISERYTDKYVFPGVDTIFMGMPVEQGVWVKRCSACGHCILNETGGICPISRCAKSLLNGPCGGSENGKCEVDPSGTECAWHLIYERMKEKDLLSELEEVVLPKDWSVDDRGGLRRHIREDMKL